MWVVRNLNQFNVTITSLKHQCGCASTHTMHTTIFLSRFVLVIVQHFEIFMSTQFKMKLGTIWKVQSWLNNYFISDDTKRPVDANIQRDYISKVSNKILSTTKFGDKTAVIRGRVASAVQANVFEDCRYNNNAHAVMSEVLDYLEKYGFIGMYDEIVTQENNESSSEVQPLEQNNINETSQLVVTEDDDEDAKQSEQSKDMEDAQKKPKKPKKPRGGNKRGLGKFVCVAKPSEIEKKKK
eukprot:589941_1